MPKANAPQPKAQVKIIIAALKKNYQPVCGLHFSNPFELLIATILSAQCTDERVNSVTPALFNAFPTAQDFSTAQQEQVEAIIRPLGFFRQKAKNIIGLSKIIEKNFGGEIPRDIQTLVTLPGVGRKTANVLLGTAYGLPAITVDTHVKRLATRLGFTTQTHPDKIEQDLIALIPASERTDFCHRLIWHGRKVCHARKPACSPCCLRPYCPSKQTEDDR
jgi:endonuclease III